MKLITLLCLPYLLLILWCLLNLFYLWYNHKNKAFIECRTMILTDEAHMSLHWTVWLCFQSFLFPLSLPKVLSNSCQTLSSPFVSILPHSPHPLNAPVVPFPSVLSTSPPFSSLVPFYCLISQQKHFLLPSDPSPTSFDPSHSLFCVTIPSLPACLQR